MDFLNEIYKNYDTETVELNKKLPKPCFGNSNGYYCNYECSKNEDCYSISMQKWGVCDCKFRPSCHTSRQKLQENFKQNISNYICPFKKYFNEETYLTITVPDGIIKMKPIKD